MKPVILVGHSHTCPTDSKCVVENEGITIRPFVGTPDKSRETS